MACGQPLDLSSGVPSADASEDPAPDKAVWEESAWTYSEPPPLSSPSIPPAGSWTPGPPSSGEGPSKFASLRLSGGGAIAALVAVAAVAVLGTVLLLGGSDDNRAAGGSGGGGLRLLGDLKGSKACTAAARMIQQAASEAGLIEGELRIAFAGEGREIPVTGGTCSFDIEEEEGSETRINLNYGNFAPSRGSSGSSFRRIDGITTDVCPSNFSSERYTRAALSVEVGKRLASATQSEEIFSCGGFGATGGVGIFGRSDDHGVWTASFLVQGDPRRVEFGSRHLASWLLDMGFTGAFEPGSVCAQAKPDDDDFDSRDYTECL